MLQKENTDQTNRLRQGVTGHNVRAVLAIGAVGAIIALALAYFAIISS